MKRQIKFMDRKTLLRNILTTALILGFSTAVSFAFYRISGNAENVPAFYMLAVVFIARFTTGYVPGIAAALISVVCVNYAFTSPYFSLAFNLDGYPVTFASMLIIACLTSMTTTHLKEKNRILREQEKLLMEAEKEKMRANLLRAVSHDLRTPLTSIIGASSTYLENGAFLSEGEKLQMVQTIYDDSNWLLHMVENLLSVTKIRQDGARLTKTLEPLEEVVSEAVSRLKKRIPDASIRVTTPENFIMVPMDATLIEQVIINLLENGIYHSGSTGAMGLTVNAAGRQVYFRIRSHGHGIREDLLPRIFDGYADTPASSGDSRKGMGIGLSICKTIIMAHNGRIWAQNLSDGALFTFTLPLGDEPYES